MIFPIMGDSKTALLVSHETSVCSLPHLKFCRDALILFVFLQAGQMVESKGGQERDLHHSSQKKTS